MKYLRIAAAAGLGLAALAATPALAAPVSGYVTANVNERSGPSTGYPPIVVIPAGSRILIYGCLADDSWCDISWGPNRGWMYSAYLQVNYQSRRIPIRGYSGIPFITFSFGPYWDSHYRNRPFFHDRSRWSNFHWQSGNNQPPNMPPPKGPKGPWPKPPMMGQGSNVPPPNMGNPGNDDHNGPNFHNGPDGYGKFKGKDCKWIDGKRVCQPQMQNPAN